MWTCLLSVFAKSALQRMWVGRLSGNRACSKRKHYGHCYECDEECDKGWFYLIKPYGFTLFAGLYGEEELLDCLERNEQNGVIYHRNVFHGDYDDFDDVDDLIEFIRTGQK